MRLGRIALSLDDLRVAIENTRGSLRRRRSSRGRRGRGRRGLAAGIPPALSDTRPFQLDGGPLERLFDDAVRQSGMNDE
jgi:hypothetical protein